MHKTITFDQPHRPGFMALAGLLVGGFIAVGVPWVVFALGPNVNLESGGAIFLAACGIIGGVVVAKKAVEYSLKPLPNVTKTDRPSGCDLTAQPAG